MRSKDYLIYPDAILKGSQLISNGEVLAVVLHHICLRKKTVQAITSMVMGMVSTYWAMTRISIMRKDNGIKKMEKLYHEYESLKEARHLLHRYSARIPSRRTSRPPWKLSMSQAGGRRWVMLMWSRVRKKSTVCREPFDVQKKRTHNEAMATSSVVELESSTSSSSTPKDWAKEDRELKRAASGKSTPERNKSASVNIMTSSLAATLDRTKITDWGVTCVLTETAHSPGVTVEELNINRSSIHQNSWKHQEHYS